MGGINILVCVLLSCNYTAAQLPSLNIGTLPYLNTSTIRLTFKVQHNGNWNLTNNRELKEIFVEKVICLLPYCEMKLDAHQAISDKRNDVMQITLLVARRYRVGQRASTASDMINLNLKPAVLTQDIQAHSRFLSLVNDSIELIAEETYRLA